MTNLDKKVLNLINSEIIKFQLGILKTDDDFVDFFQYVISLYEMDLGQKEITLEVYEIVEEIYRRFDY